MPNETIQFRQLADMTQASLPPQIPALNELYLHFGLDVPDGYLSMMDVIDQLRSRIGALVFSATAPPRTDHGVLRTIERQLLLEYFGEDAPNLAYLELIETIAHSRPNSEAALGIEGREDNWREAIALAKDILRIQPADHLQDRDFLQYTNARLARQAHASRTLRKFGYPIVIADGQPGIVDADRARLLERFDVLAAQLGGINLLRYILQTHAHSYHDRMERYLFPRRSDGQRPSAIPVGYLVNLAIRHGQSTTIPADAAQQWTELVTLTTAYCALFDLESYNIFDTMVYSLAGLLELTPRLALYDSLYTLVQWRWSDLPLFLEELFSCVTEAEARGALGLTISQTIGAVRALGPQMIPPNFRLLAFKPEDLDRLTKIGADELAVRQFCTVLTAPSPNANFLAPEDQHDAEILEHPFILTDHGVTPLPSPLAGPAVFNAICNALQATTAPKIHDRIGFSFEKLVTRLFYNAGVTYIRGFYHVGRDRFECDFIVETPECILLIELKKKILTRRARGGDVIAVLSDLATSLFAAHLQLVRHEKQLRDLGTLQIVDEAGARQADVVWGGRRVERVALSLQEFGALQDRSVVRDFLTFLPGNTFATGALTQKQAQAIAKLEATCTEIERLEDEIRPNAQGLRFPNAAFLSVGNLSVILDNVATNEDLVRELGHTRHVSTAQHDFYSSYSYLRTLPSAQR